MELLAYCLIALACIIAYVLGLLSKGINININHTPSFDEEEYNKSPDVQDPEVKQYLDENHGQVKF